jgi:hypothetical protein
MRSPPGVTHLRGDAWIRDPIGFLTCFENSVECRRHTSDEVERKQIPHLRVMGRNIRFLKSDLEPFRATF